MMRTPCPVSMTFTVAPRQVNDPQKHGKARAEAVTEGDEVKGEKSGVLWLQPSTLARDLGE